MKLEDTDSNVIGVPTEVPNMACQTTEQPRLKAGSPPIESQNSEKRKSPKEGRRKSDTMPAEESMTSVNKPQTDITSGKKKQPQEWPAQKEAYNENQKVKAKPYDGGGHCKSCSESVTKPYYDGGGVCKSCSESVTNRKASPSENEAECDLSKDFSTKLHLSDDMTNDIDKITVKTKELNITTEQDNKSDEPQKGLKSRKPPGVPIAMRSSQGIPNYETNTDLAYGLYMQEHRRHNSGYKRGREFDSPMLVKGFKDDVDRGVVREPVENSDNTSLDDDLKDMIFNSPPQEPCPDGSPYSAAGYHNGCENPVQWSDSTAFAPYTQNSYVEPNMLYNNHVCPKIGVLFPKTLEPPKPWVGLAPAPPRPNVDKIEDIEAYLRLEDCREPPKPKYSPTPNQPFPVTGLAGWPGYCASGMPHSGNAFANTAQSSRSQPTGRSHDQRLYSVDSSPVSGYSTDSTPVPSPGSESTVTTYNEKSPAATSVYPSSPESVYSRDGESVQSPDSGYSHTVPSPEWTPGNESSNEQCLYLEKPYTPVPSDVTKVKDYAQYGLSGVLSDDTNHHDVPSYLHPNIATDAQYGLSEVLSDNTNHRELPSYIHPNIANDAQNRLLSDGVVPDWDTYCPADICDYNNEYINPEDRLKDIEDYIKSDIEAVVPDCATQRPLPPVLYSPKSADSDVAPVASISQSAYIKPTSTVATVVVPSVAVASNPIPILPAPSTSTGSSETRVSVPSNVQCTTATIIVPAPNIVFVRQPVIRPPNEKQILDKYPPIKPHPGPINRTAITESITTSVATSAATPAATAAGGGTVMQSPKNTPPTRVYAKPVRQQPQKVMPNRTADVETTRLNNARKYICKLSSEDLITRDKDGDMLLQVAIMKESSYVFMASLERLHREGLLAKAINNQNNRRQTPLYLAVVQNNLAMVTALVQRGCDVNIQAAKEVSNQGMIFRGPLHYASARGTDWLPVLQALLQSTSFVDIDGTNSDGHSALHCAVTAHGIRPDRTSIDSKLTIQLLLAHNAKLDRQDGKSGKTPLHYIIEKKDLDLLCFVLRLIPKGEVPRLLQMKTYDSNNSLHLAVGLYFIDFEQHKFLISLLMKNGADASLKNSKDLPKAVICSSYNNEQKRQISEILVGGRTNSHQPSLPSPSRTFPAVASPPLLPATVPTTVAMCSDPVSDYSYMVAREHQ